MERKRLFQVSIDTTPGGWKSGGDPFELVLATSKEEAKKLVEEGWSNVYDFDDNNVTYTYGKNLKDSPYYEKDRGYRLSVVEVKFKGVDLIFTTEREEKIKNVLKEKRES